MVTFSLAFLLQQAAALSFSPVQLATLIAGSLAIVAAWWCESRELRPHLGPATIGVALGLLLPCPSPRVVVPIDGARGPFTLIGSVASGACEVDDGIQFGLDGGVSVLIPNSNAAPFPGDVIQLVGSWSDERTRFIAASSEAVSLVSPSHWLHPLRMLEVLRRSLRDRLTHRLPPDVAGFMRAVALGDRALPKDARKWCATAGVLHLIAVSGSHLSLVLAGLGFVTRRAGVLAIAIGLYAMLTGLESPVLRSLIPALATLVGRAWARQVAPLPWLFLSAVVVVALDRSALVSPGFQLSWCAFAALPSSGADGWRGQIVAGMRAAVATIPIIAWHFLRIPLVGIPATMLLAPLIPCLLLLAAGLMAFPGNPLLVALATSSVRLLIDTTEWFASLPFATLEISRCHPIWPGMFLASLAALAWVPTLRSPRALLFIAIVSGLGNIVSSPPHDGIHPIPAGRGSSTLFISNGVKVLVDTGPPEGRVVESLRRRGVDRLDAVIITHADIDHSGGLNALMRSFGTCPVYGPPAARDVVKGYEWHPLVRGHSLSFDSLTFDILGPVHQSKAHGTNETGLITLVNCKGLTALATGDAEDAGLGESLRFMPRQVNLLWLPHHGSESKQLPALLARVKPDIAIAAGRDVALAASTRSLLAGLTIPLVHVTPGSHPPSFP